MLSLKENTLVSVTAKLLSDPYFRLIIKRWTDEKWKKDVRSKISICNIPLTLVEEIIVLMKPLALEIHNWMVDHNGIFTEEQECSLEFCFNPDGTLNRVKTAELLIHSKLLNDATRFMLACQYWPGWNVFTYFINLPKSSREQILHKYSIANKNWNEHEVNAGQWIDLFNAGYEFEPPRPKGWFYIHHDWTDVPLQSRLLDYLSEEACKHRLDLVFEETEKMHVGRFCLSRMSVDHREQLLKSFPLKVLRIYLLRPYHHFFLDAANKFPCRNCERGNRWLSPSIVPSGNFAELNRTVTCMVLKANDRRTSSPMPR
ncbi:uncharacterized protein TNCV_5106861 [Trichonephila clavipes]|uniref:Uncharacterized protein n=1 Tax=Trichonephila clavipes TaxID=2585209 RepID=A0A8X6RG65_TRICX|nr:uncharacterized protein TNCV_5106861 [Trichonephila clavipes]